MKGVAPLSSPQSKKFRRHDGSVRVPGPPRGPAGSRRASRILKVGYGRAARPPADLTPGPSDLALEKTRKTIKVAWVGPQQPRRPARPTLAPPPELMAGLLEPQGVSGSSATTAQLALLSQQQHRRDAFHPPKPPPVDGRVTVPEYRRVPRSARAKPGLGALPCFPADDMKKAVPPDVPPPGGERPGCDGQAPRPPLNRCFFPNEPTTTWTIAQPRDILEDAP